MRVALYARVSKDEADSRGKLQDPENQLVPLRKFCEAMEWLPGDEYVDRASGGNSNRPGFQRMMAKIRQGHYQIVLVWALDRFSREGIPNTMGYINTLRGHSCGLKSLQESWLDTRKEGIADLILAVMAWASAEERRKISQRTKAGLAEAKRKGKRLGRPPKKAPPTSL